MELRVDHSYQYSALKFGPRISREVGGRGFKSEVGRVRVILDMSEDRRVAQIEFAAKMSGFFGEAYYQRLFARPCDGRPQSVDGLAAIYDYVSWYENEGFFAMYLDPSLDQARLCLRPPAEIPPEPVEEYMDVWRDGSSEQVVLEWDGELLTALRFESASTLLPFEVLERAIRSPRT